MAALSPGSPSGSWKQLLQIGLSNNGISGSLQFVQDGNGTNTALKLSTNAVDIEGTLTVNGLVPFSVSAPLTVTTAITLNGNSNTLNLSGNLTVAGTSSINGTFSCTSSGTNTGDQSQLNSFSASSLCGNPTASSGTTQAISLGSTLSF